MSRTIEPDDFGDIVERFVKAYFRRIRANEDAYDLCHAKRVLLTFRSELKFTAKHLHKKGASAANLADALGITKRGMFKQLGIQPTPDEQ